MLEAMYGSMHKGADDRPTEQWRSVTASNGPMIKYFTIAPTINYHADFKSAICIHKANRLFQYLRFEAGTNDIQRK